MEATGPICGAETRQVNSCTKRQVQPAAGRWQKDAANPLRQRTTRMAALCTATIHTARRKAAQVVCKLAPGICPALQQPHNTVCNNTVRQPQKGHTCSSKTLCALVDRLATPWKRSTWPCQGSCAVGAQPANRTCRPRHAAMQAANNQLQLHIKISTLAAFKHASVAAPLLAGDNAPSRRPRTAAPR